MTLETEPGATRLDVVLRLNYLTIIRDVPFPFPRNISLHKLPCLQLRRSCLALLHTTILPVSHKLCEKPSPSWLIPSPPLSRPRKPGRWPSKRHPNSSR